jgi:hypothetical protein
MYLQVLDIHNQHALMSSRLQLNRSGVWTDSVDKVNPIPTTPGQNQPL